MSFAVTLGLVAFCTFVALVPLRPLGRANYFFAVVVNEIPHVAALYLILAAGLAWVEGDMRGAAGLVLTGLVAMTLAGLVVLARRGLVAGDAFDAD